MTFGKVYFSFLQESTAVLNYMCFHVRFFLCISDVLLSYRQALSNGTTLVTLTQMKDSLIFQGLIQNGKAETGSFEVIKKRHFRS